MVRQVSMLLTKCTQYAYPRQGSHGDWKTWKMKMVIEKSWNVKKWPKVIQFCDSVMEFYQFCPQFVVNLDFLGFRF